MVKATFSGTYSFFRTLLTEAREKKGLTQAQVAQELGKPQSYVSKYERGERRLDVIEFLAVTKALGLEPSEIFKEVNRHYEKDNSR